MGEGGSLGSFSSSAAAAVAWGSWCTAAVNTSLGPCTMVTSCGLSVVASSSAAPASSLCTGEDFTSMVLGTTFASGFGRSSAAALAFCLGGGSVPLLLVVDGGRGSVLTAVVFRISRRDHGDKSSVEGGAAPGPWPEVLGISA